MLGMFSRGACIVLCVQDGSADEAGMEECNGMWGRVQAELGKSGTHAVEHFALTLDEPATQGRVFVGGQDES